MTATTKWQELQAYNAKLDILLVLGNRLRDKGREVVEAIGKPGDRYQHLEKEHQALAEEHRLLAEEIETEGNRLLASYATH